MKAIQINVATLDKLIEANARLAQQSVSEANREYFSGRVNLLNEIKTFCDEVEVK